MSSVASVSRSVCQAINRDLTSASRAIVAENMWRAQRSGVQAGFIDEAGAVTTFPEHLDAILTDVAADADALGCSAEVARARQIVAEGASADRQRAVYARAKAEGAPPSTALAAVIDWMSEATIAQPPPR